MAVDTQIMGYRRSDGSVGIRNYVAVISTVACSNHIAESIATAVPGAVALAHQHGCDQLGADLDLSFRTLAGIGKNGNVAAVLVVGLGCEEIVPVDLASDIARSGKPVECLVMQEVGGTTESISRGVEMCYRLASSIPARPEALGLDSLIVGLECGGSDFTSGIASNPAVGEASDMLVDRGARVVFCETTEIIGAEHILARRAANERVKEFLFDKVALVEASARQMKVDIRGAQPSPGNIAGGLTTIEEKSLGAICKSGSRPIVNVFESAEPNAVPGLNFMDSPGNDITSVAGLAAAGAQVIVFTTGRGTPMGFATTPVLKLCANRKTVERMGENIDVDLSGVMEGTVSVRQAGQAVFDSIVAAANGRLVRAEVLGHREFGIHRIGPTL